mmetsp:Transcript_61448/g.180310  ORF Transcript_61448/g.180310 Transcript_61448/m.180310 type:complete len:428 (+) Transcript_61448:569-1852(+)
MVKELPLVVDAAHIVRVLRPRLVRVAERLHHRPAHADVVLPEGVGDLAHDHRHVDRQVDEDRGHVVVKVVAEADLVAHIHTHVFPRVRELHGVGVGEDVDVIHELALGLLVPQAVDHGLVDGGEEPVVADEPLQVRLPQRLVHAVPDHGEGDRDAAAAEVAHDVLDHVGRGRVDAHDGRHLEHQVFGLVDVPEVLDVGEQHVLDEGGVGEVHGRADARDEDARDERAAALLLHVAVDRGAGDAPEDRDLRPRGLVDDNHEGEPHGDGDAGEDAGEQGADEGDDPEHKVLPLEPEELHRLAVGHERDHRADHDRGQHELREVVEEGRQEEHHEKHEEARHQARELGLRPGRVVHRGPREAARHRIAGEHGPDEVREAQRQELLARVDVVAVLRGEVLPDGDRLHVADEAHGERRGQHHGQVAQLPGRD